MRPLEADEELAVLRRMTPAQKLAVMNTLIRQAYRLKAAGIRAASPDLSEDDIQARVRAVMGGDRA